MSHDHPNNFPKLHNAAWPGVVGKGQGGEPPIDLDTMLDLTADAEVDGVRFDGVRPVPLRAARRHRLRATTRSRRLADKARARNLEIGSVVAPVWPPTGGGSAMGSAKDRKRFLAQVHKACRIARRLRELGVRPNGVVRIDSACGVAEWSRRPERQPEADRRDVPRGRARSPRTTASGWPPRAKSAGAACTVGGG